MQTSWLTFSLLGTLLVSGIQCRWLHDKGAPGYGVNQPSGKQKGPDKEKILCIIETQLTPGRCRDTAMERAQNGHDPLTACTTLMASEHSLPAIGCDKTDFLKLKDVVCDNKDVPCYRTGNFNDKGAPGYGVNQPAGKQQGPDKEKILCIIETQLTPGRCRDTARERAQNGHDPLTACTTLMASEHSLPAIGCDKTDFLKLKDVVCDNKDVPCYRTDDSGSPSNKQIRVQHKRSADNSKGLTKEKVLCIIDTQLTAGQCRDTAREHAEHDHNLESACATVMAFRSNFSAVGCMEEDFYVMRALVCDHEDMPCTLTETPRSMDQSKGPSKELIMCIIETQLTPGVCRNTARDRANDGTDPKTACNTLQTMKAGFEGLCSKDDYLKMEAVVCDHKEIPCTRTDIMPSGENEGPTKENVLCVIETQLTPGRCRDTAKERAENGHDPKTACSTLMAAEHSLPAIGCQKEDFLKLKAVVCDNQPCYRTDKPTTNQIEIPKTRAVGFQRSRPSGPNKEKIQCIIETQLTPGRCRETARERAQNGHDPLTACSTLMASEKTLPAIGCTQEDFETLKAVVCDNDDVPCVMPASAVEKPSTGQVVIQPMSTPKNVPRGGRQTTRRQSAHSARSESRDPVIANIRCVIEQQLSSERCKRVSRARLLNRPRPKVTCSALIALTGTLEAQGCTEEDLQRLKVAICDRKSVPCNRNTSGSQ